MLTLSAVNMLAHPLFNMLAHPSACVSMLCWRIRQHASASVSIRQRMRQHI
jgi:hypothetical protein